MFPVWEDVKIYEQVVIFTCGLMESPEPLVDHVYELNKEREKTWVRTNTWDTQRERLLASLGINVLDRHLHDTLYSESRVPLPGKPFHNRHVNYFSEKDKNETQQITVLSKIYWFTNLKQHVVLNISQDIQWKINQNKNQRIKEDFVMFGILNPDKKITKELFSTWHNLSKFSH